MMLSYGCEDGKLGELPADTGPGCCRRAGRGAGNEGATIVCINPGAVQ